MVVRVGKCGRAVMVFLTWSEFTCDHETSVTRIRHGEVVVGILLNLVRKEYRASLIQQSKDFNKFWNYSSLDEMTHILLNMK